ncbi:hypothetical protein M3Y97_00889800 [Aphelenchoides bicaudatus]|nr:hypothetical protein M3Y97_00889800 [Aphelenchoides bicaudatus]
MSVEIKKSPESAGNQIGLKESNCSSLVNSIRAEDMNNAFKEELNKALTERDEIWRKHEKSQISYLQQQNAQMLSRLHVEIERLQNINRDLERRLYVSTEPETFDELQNEIAKYKSTNEALRKEVASAENRSRQLAQNLEQSAKLYKDQVTDHEARIRQLTAELDHRTLTITQLSTQLRNFKLREAMAQAQQRRRASCIEPLKQTSPTATKPAGFRLFAGATSSASSTVNPTQRFRVDVPGNGTVVKPNASVSVAYPAQNRRLPFIGNTSNSIEKPSLNRSISVGIPPTKPHLLHALRNAQEISSGEDQV